MLRGNKRIVHVAQEGTDTPHLIHYPKYAKWYDTIPILDVLVFVNSSFDLYSYRGNFLGLYNILCCHLGIQP